ncbi:zinc-ribbon domain-containing protein [Streptomyces sp. NPDC093108]|uniref:zinc-ribbon domain-containing protein n=1 Tax=Streptomyces sp. NPDC093108 TaxID=3366030 RepID=UPI0038022C5D
MLVSVHSVVAQLTPSDPTIGARAERGRRTLRSTFRAWWLCPAGGHAWNARVYSQDDRRGCPPGGRLVSARAACIPPVRWASR